MRIGIDLGGTNTVAGLCTDEGRLIDKKSVPAKCGNPDGVRADMLALIRALCEENQVRYDEIHAVGVGVPGTVDKRACTLTYAPNLRLDGVCFADTFAEMYTGPVFLDNDANCAALGEYTAGAGQGAQNMLMMTIGTGVGGGLIINGRLYTGSNDIAGEIGHMVVAYDGLPCNCGRKGCWEAYCSAHGMVRMAERMMEAEENSILHLWKRKRGGTMDAKMICDAKDNGDVLAGAVFDSYIGYLACGVNNLIAILQPEVIVIGGGLSGYGAKLLLPLQKLVRENLMKASGAQADLRLAQMGNDAGIVGAAMLEN